MVCARPGTTASHLRSGFAVLLLGGVAAMGASHSASAQVTTEFLFSTDNDEKLQNKLVYREDVWTFDTSQALGSEITEILAQTGASMFTAGGQVDAFTWRDGIYYFSTAGPSTLADNGLVIDKDDIVRYDPSAAAGSRAALHYDPDLHGTDSNVNALSFHSDGDLLVSFDSNETFAGLGVLDGDILKFDLADPVGTRSIFFSESTFTSGDEDIAGFEFVSATEMYLTVQADGQLPGSPLFTQSDIVRWDGSSGTIVVHGGDFGSTDAFNLDAIGAVPEPSLVLVLAIAAGRGFRRRREAATP
ncbi:MAG: hypothetical protein HKN82_09260 [Akkermansiaceae bacterium]|nr:hypothetical protein [Akkermansiaceae bacterium]NNM28630.1 hypothetical protein [Akkermansiaceae bacterium]